MPDESMTLAETPTPSYRALGVSGLIHYGFGAHGDGRVYEEWLKALRGVEGARVYREMQDNDPIIGAILFSTEMLLRQVDWSVEPASEKQEDKDNATFVEECLHDMRQTWEDTLSEIMSMLPFGWAFLETVFKRRTATNSKYDDGKIGWAIWGIRGQDTLDHWEFDENNEANALVQLSPPDYTFHTIPLAKGMLFRTTSRKSNPQGRSVLRNAFVSWYRKKHIEAMEAIGVERDLSGLPMLKIPAEVIIANGADYVNYQTLARNIRNDEQGSIILPSDRDMHGQPYYSFELISSPGKRPFDTDAIITRYDQRILMTVMADFIMVGHERVGSNAMVRSKSKLFTAAIQSYLDSIAAVVNETGIPQLLRYNGIKTATPPRLMHGNVERADMDVLGTFLLNMAQAMRLGGQALNLQPGSDLYNFIMDQAGLPKSGPLAVGVDPSPSAVPAPAAPATPGQVPKPAVTPVRPEPAATPLKKQQPTGRDTADHPTLTEE